MKKLFADPHFNVMDGLDTYIDDYGKPDPIPLAMLRQMNQSKFLRLFDDDEEEERSEERHRPRDGGHRRRTLEPLPMTTLICDCNKTMPLDGPGLIKALGPDAGAGLQTVHTTLCRREAGAFQRAAKSGDDLLVACTQESRLFLELNEQTEGAAGVAERPIRFVNIRETGGWSKDAKAATPKIAALIALAQLPDAEPVPTVSYRSNGRVLVIGDADRAARAAQMLADKLVVSLLLQGGGTLPQQRSMAVHSGAVTTVRGWLGAFEVSWTQSNPIDLDLCTRCNACIEVCPENAIDFSYQIDLAKCRDHRDCVRVCEAAGAIDFQRAPQAVTEAFDLVLDLNDMPAIALHQPPQGYFHAADDAALMSAVLQLRDSVGEFEKPKFFQYKQKICAHSRNEQIGCTACIDVCSAQAIRSDASMKGGPAARRRPASSSSRICASAAVPAPRSARAARSATRRRGPTNRASASARCSRPTTAPAASMPRC